MDLLIIESNCSSNIIINMIENKLYNFNEDVKDVKINSIFNKFNKYYEYLLFMQIIEKQNSFIKHYKNDVGKLQINNDIFREEINRLLVINNKLRNKNDKLQATFSR